MNVILGEVKDFVQKDELSLVLVETKLGEFSVLMLNYKALNALKKAKIQLLFKENELVLANKEAKIAAENVFEGKILSIKKGELLWEIFLEQNLSSVITAKAAQKLNLKENDEVLCFVKASDIILKVLR